MPKIGCMKDYISATCKVYICKEFRLNSCNGNYFAHINRRIRKVFITLYSSKNIMTFNICQNIQKKIKFYVSVCQHFNELFKN